MYILLLISLVAVCAVIVWRVRLHRLVREFALALGAGAVTVEDHESRIFEPGCRCETTFGLARGAPYSFRAIIWDLGSRHLYILAWTGKGRAKGRWSAERDRASSLRDFYFELVRLRRPPDGCQN